MSVSCILTSPPHLSTSPHHLIRWPSPLPTQLIISISVLSKRATISHCLFLKDSSLQICCCYDFTGGTACEIFCCFIVMIFQIHWRCSGVSFIKQREGTTLKYTYVQNTKMVYTKIYSPSQWRTFLWGLILCACSVYNWDRRSLSQHTLSESQSAPRTGHQCVTGLTQIDTLSHLWAT